MGWPFQLLANLFWVPKMYPELLLLSFEYRCWYNFWWGLTLETTPAVVMLLEPSFHTPGISGLKQRSWKLAFTDQEVKCSLKQSCRDRLLVSHDLRANSYLCALQTFSYVWLSSWLWYEFYLNWVWENQEVGLFLLKAHSNSPSPSCSASTKAHYFFYR